MAITFPSEVFPPIKPDLESVESFDNSQVGGIEKFGSVSTGVVSIEDVLALTGGTMTGPVVLAASAAGNVDGSVRFVTGVSPSSPAEGATWNDSTQKVIIGYINSIKQALSGCVFAQTSSATVANTTDETAISGSGVGSLTLPTNFLVAGKTLKVSAWGILSDTGTPTLRIQLKLGSTTVADTGAITLGGTISNNVWKCEVLLTCRTVGGSGTVFTQGLFHYDESTHAGTSLGMANTATSTIDTTATQAISLTADWGTASSSNTITCTNLVVEVLY